MESAGAVKYDRHPTSNFASSGLIINHLLSAVPTLSRTALEFRLFAGRKKKQL